MSKTEPMDTKSKFKLMLAQRLGRQKSELADAMYNWKNINPYAVYSDGMPSYWPHKLIFMAGVIAYIIMWVITEKCVNEEIVMDLASLESLNTLAIGILIAGIFAIMYMLIDSHNGTFGHYKIQIEPCKVTVLNTNETFHTALRVLDAWEIWPPTGHFVEIVIPEVDENGVKADDYRVLRKAVEEIKDNDTPKTDEVPTPAPTTEVKSTDGTVTVQEQEIRYSNVHDVRTKIAEYYPSEDKKLQEFDPKTEATDLRVRWHALCEGLQLPYRVTILRCVSPHFVVVLSDYTLIEGASTEVKDERYRGEYVEIERKQITQHTFVWTGKNNNAGECEFAEIYQGKYYTRIDKRLLLRRIKKRELKIVPILWVTGSDGRRKRETDQISASIKRKVPTSGQITMTRDILDATMTEESIMLVDLVTQEHAREVKKNDKKDELDAVRNKNIVARMMRDWRMSGKTQTVGLTSKLVNLISTKAMNIIGMIAVIYIILAFILNMVSLSMGAPVPWMFPDWTGGTPTPEPGTGPIPDTGDDNGAIWSVIDSIRGLF